MTRRPTAGLRALAAVAAFAAAIGVSADAAPADPKAEAKKHYKKGEQLYGAGKYAEAAKEFEASYASYPKADLLINVGQSYRLAGDLPKARRHYQLFLDSATDSDRRAEVRQIVKSIDKALADESAAKLPPPAPPPPALPPAIDPEPSPIVTAPSPPPEPEPPRPLIKTWWFWAAIGGVVMIGAGAYAYVHRND